MQIRTQQVTAPFCVRAEPLSRRPPCAGIPTRALLFQALTSPTPNPPAFQMLLLVFAAFLLGSPPVASQTTCASFTTQSSCNAQSGCLYIFSCSGVYRPPTAGSSTSSLDAALASLSGDLAGAAVGTYIGIAIGSLVGLILLVLVRRLAPAAPQIAVAAPERHLLLNARGASEPHHPTPPPHSPRPCAAHLLVPVLAGLSAMLCLLHLRVLQKVGRV